MGLGVVYNFEPANRLRRCGGIGRRDGFKIHWGQPRGGSSPLTGTLKPAKLCVLLAFLFTTVKTLSQFSP